MALPQAPGRLLPLRFDAVAFECAEDIADLDGAGGIALARLAEELDLGAIGEVAECLVSFLAEIDRMVLRSGDGLPPCTFSKASSTMRLPRSPMACTLTWKPMPLALAIIASSSSCVQKGSPRFSGSSE